MHLRMRRWTAAMFVLSMTASAAGLPARAWGQSTVTLEGRVLDDSGAPIGEADVAVVATETGERRQVVTRVNGAFRVMALSPGSYTVTVRAPGYHAREQATDLVLGQRRELRFELQPDAIALQRIDVPASRAAGSEIRRASISTPVLEEEIRHLPLSTRSVMDLAALAPGIRFFRPLGGHSLPSAGALRGERFLNLYVDGVELKNVYDGNLVGFPQTGSPLPADALREFRVYLNPYDATYARAATYVITAVTHRGTNETHGSAFGFLQPRNLVAGNDFLRARPNYTDADFERQQLGLTLRGPIVRDRLFYASSYELSNTRNYVTVVPPRPSVEPGLWDEHAGIFETPNRNHTGLLRLTYTPRAVHTIDVLGSIRYSTNVGRFGRNVSYESAVTDKHVVTTLSLRHRWLAGERLANELSFQFVDWTNAGRARTPRPVHVYGDGLRIGAPASTFEIDERHFRFINRLSFALDGAHGSHLVNAGLEVERVTLDNFFPFLSHGRFEFESHASTLPVQAVIGIGARFPASEREARSTASGWVTGVYVNNEWRPISNLTLTIGVRYDAELGLMNNDLTVPWSDDPELAAIPVLQPYLNRGNRSDDLDNVSPRLSFSWDPLDDGRTSLRGGFGIIHDRIPGFIAFQEQADAGWRTYVFADPGTTDPETLRQRVTAGEGSPVSFTVVANDIDAPESRQWSIGLGRQITPDLSLNVDYVHQDVRNLFAELNLNWLDRSVSRRALSSRYGDIVVWDDFARARYRALLSHLSYQPNADTRLSLAYTLGRAEADWDGANASVPANVAAAYYVMQRTSGDERHRFVLSGQAPLPFDVRLSLIATVASPRPYPAIVGIDVNQNAFPSDDWLDEQRFLVPSNDWRNWYRVVDVRLARAVRFHDGLRGNVILEAFNVLNAENYATFQGRQLQPTGEPVGNFRQPDGVFGTRQLQVGLRLDF